MQSSGCYSSGEHVYIRLGDGYQYPGEVKSFDVRPDGHRLYTVEFPDGTHADVQEHVIRSAPVDVYEAAEVPVRAIQPTEEKVRAFEATARLPPPSIAADFLPGGAKHCGGDLCFCHLTMAHASLGRKMPHFMMAPGAFAAFSGAGLCHCTTEHDDEEDRPLNCRAHISFAVQVCAPHGCNPVVILPIVTATFESHAGTDTGRRTRAHESVRGPTAQGSASTRRARRAVALLAGGCVAAGLAFR